MRDCWHFSWRLWMNLLVRFIFAVIINVVAVLISALPASVIGQMISWLIFYSGVYTAFWKLGFRDSSRKTADQDGLPPASLWLCIFFAMLPSFIVFIAMLTVKLAASDPSGWIMGCYRILNFQNFFFNLVCIEKSLAETGFLSLLLSGIPILAFPATGILGYTLGGKGKQIMEGIMYSKR